MKQSLLLLAFCLVTAIVTQGQSAQTAQAPPSTAAAIVAPSPVAENVTAIRAALVLPVEKSRPASVPMLKQPPIIDGLLDDEVWQSAAVFKDFYQTDPGDNIAPSKPTEVFVGYDSKFLYLAFHAYDEPDKVRATMAKRDDIFDDDYVGVLLDTFNDERRAYELFFNAFGVQADGIFAEGKLEDFSVDVVMESKGRLTEDGYVVEVAIPFKSLRYEAGKGVLWGVHLQRVIKRFNDETDSWMPLSRDRTGLLNQAGHLTGLEDISTERTLEIIPSLTFSETGRRVATLAPALLVADPLLLDPGHFVNEPMRVDPGVTVKYGFNPKVTLDFTLNPDFAQVEADETVVTANQRFPIFFEEKRPFFLEGIDIFQTPLQAVHTRTIIDPDYAVKLTGKVGRNTFGLLLGNDNAPGDFRGDERLDPNNFRFLDKNAYLGILRLKRDIGRESSIGLIATTYSFIEKHNLLGGVDGQFRLNPSTVFSFQLLGTNSRRFFFDPEQAQTTYRTGNGFAYYWNYDKGGRHLSYNFNGSGRTEDYRADLGFTLRRDTNREDFIIRYNSEPQPDGKVVSWSFVNNGGTNFDWQGRMQSWNSTSQFRVNLQRQTALNVGYTRGYERLFETEFGPVGTFLGDDNERSSPRQSLIFYGETTPSKKFSTAFTFSYIWNSFDFDLGGGLKFPRVSPAAIVEPEALLDPGPGEELKANLTFTYQPTSALRFDFDYTKDRLVRNDTGLLAFDDNIYALRSTYQFTRFTFVRARIDYDSLEANVSGQFLLGWTPNPGTSFYIGYNDDLNRNGFNPFTAQPEPGFRRNGRTFFIKMSYLFRRSF
ncbi:MAG TPA: DUF5916 domain-containing protein [Pyrinomonadaceae bacterium]|jgi:hypothetical protein|nr:DUF5916 domain-containing protein [Pyrinomonadaceae bacterium]